jgi:hypothetical protein
MSGTLSPPAKKTRIFPFEEFMGLDAYRDNFALDTGKQQYLAKLDNGFCDFRGTIIRDAGATKRHSIGGVIDHVNFVSEDISVWAQIDGAGVTLNSDRNHKIQDVFPINAVVSSTIFGRKVYFFCRDQQLRIYDGLSWNKSKSKSDPRPAFGVAIQRRLATAGYINDPTTIYFTRTDDAEVFPGDEEPNYVNPLKAFKLDISNQISTADKIRGLGVFEKNNLAIFTSDQALIYYIDPDYTKAQIVDKANVNVGTISHRTIATAGTDLLFCSRHGVHSLRRSDANGITIYTIPLSHSVELLYRQLYKRTPDKEAINAYYDQDRGQYHIFFPLGPQLCNRLTLTINPVADGVHKWSTGTFLRARCGARLGDAMVWGTPDGIYNVHDIEDSDATVYPDMIVETPIIWNGALNDMKDSHSFVLQASGKCTIVVEAFDERGRQLSSYNINVDDGAADDNFTDVPLNRQYERKFEHRYRGLKFRFTVTGTGLVRIVGFAVLVRA